MNLNVKYKYTIIQVSINIKKFHFGTHFHIRFVLQNFIGLQKLLFQII